MQRGLGSAARNGSEAVDSFYDNDPDLIVLDVMMPIMNGTEVCRIIRRRNKTVLFCS